MGRRKKKLEISDMTEEQFESYKNERENYYESTYKEGTVVELTSDYIGYKKGLVGIVIHTFSTDYRSKKTYTIKKIAFMNGRIFQLCNELDLCCRVTGFEENIEEFLNKINVTAFSRKKN